MSFLGLHVPIPLDAPWRLDAIAQVLAELEGLGLRGDVVEGVRRNYVADEGLEDVFLVAWEASPDALTFSMADLRDPAHRADLEQVRGRPVGYMSLRALLADAMNEARESELAALRQPHPALDVLPVLRLPLREGFVELIRQAIREHQAREQDPQLRRDVETSGPGRPGGPGTWLARALFELLRHGYAGSDAERHRAIAQSLAALGVPMTPKQIKDRLAAAVHHARAHPSAKGPEVFQPADSPHARKIRAAIRALDSHRGRQRRD